MKSFIIYLLVFPLFSFAEGPIAKVKKLRGNVTFNGKKVTLNSILKEGGEVKTEKSSFIKIEIKKWGNAIVIGPNSVMTLNFDKPKAKTKYTFVKGICRWLTTDKKAQSKTKGKYLLNTKSAAMGIRGTDFILEADEELIETQIFMLSGEVAFKNLKRPRDIVILKKGEWAGVGGRFGTSIGEVLTIPKPVIQRYKKAIPDV